MTQMPNYLCYSVSKPQAELQGLYTDFFRQKEK